MRLHPLDAPAVAAVRRPACPEALRAPHLLGLCKRIPPCAPGSSEQLAAGVAQLSVSQPAGPSAARPMAARPPSALPGGDASTEGRPVPRSEVAANLRKIMPHKPPPNPQAEEKFATRTVDVLTNYFPMQTASPIVYQYVVAFEPTLDSRTMRYSMLTAHESVIGDTFAFDGMQLFLLKRLDQKTTFLKSTRKFDGQEFEISVQLVNELLPKDCYQLYNILFRKILRLLKLKQIGRNYYDPTKSASIPQHHMELWPGYSTAIAAYDLGSMLNIDVTHKVLRTDTVLDHLYGLKSRMRNEADLKEAAAQYLIGQVVLTRYNNKTYHVDDVAWNLNPASKFKKSTGEEISYVDYYMKNYNLKINDLQQPLLLNKAKKKFKGGQRGGEREEEIIYLVPELCCMTGFTEEVKSNFSIMRDISQHTIVPPASRRASLLSFINTLTTHPEISEELKKWNINFKPEMLKLAGRVLNPEKIFFKNKQVSYDPRQADWGRDLKQVDLLDAVPLRDWVVIYSERTRPAPEKFIQAMNQAGRPLGIQVAPPKEVPLKNDRPSDFVEAIREAYKPGSTQLVVIILPDNRKERYDAVKKYCIADVGIVSQCVLVKTINNEKIMMSAVTKIILQINVKLGGQLWGVEIPMKKAMIIGIDVYHDSLQKGTSVVGFIASTNDIMTKYFSRCLFQRTGQEIVDGLKVLFPDALRKYHELNGGLPDRIIVFRDGVGEGQVSFVVQHEIRQMRECFAAFGPTYEPKFAFVIVTKRIGTRFMQDLGRTVENPPPGTLVNYGCTGDDIHEYFIVAQAVRQGSVTPTAYHVVYDTSGLQAIHLHTLTFKMTHLYYNWPGTVRVPAPCQYAHKIAFLIGQSVHKDPKISLADKLYFL